MQSCSFIIHQYRLVACWLGFTILLSTADTKNMHRNVYCETSNTWTTYVIFGAKFGLREYVKHNHYCDVIMGAVASQITSLTIVYSTVHSDTAQRKHQSSASLAFVRGIHRGPVHSPHKWPVTRKKFPFDDVIIIGQLNHPTVARKIMHGLVR